MASLLPTYNDTTTDITLDVRERTGGPRRPRRAATERRDFYERFSSTTSIGSHMPLDTDIHWDWSNPLNIIPGLALLLMIVTAVALIAG